MAVRLNPLNIFSSVCQINDPSYNNPVFLQLLH